MMKVNSVSNFSTQYQAKNNNCSTYKKEYLSDSVSFKSKLATTKPNKSLLKRLGAMLGIGSVGTAATVATVATASNATKKEESEWNSECEGYKELVSEGFSDDIIEKTLNKLEPESAKTLKIGLNTRILHGSGCVQDLYDVINKEINDDEKSAEITFNILSDVFDKAIKSNVSKDEHLYIGGITAAVRIYGLDAFNRGKLVNVGYWNSYFRLEDENGKDITDREQERIDSDGNKIIEEIDSYGEVKKHGKGKKYSPDDRLLEEWSSGSHTTYEYDENNQLIGKQEEYGNGFHRHLDKYKYISGSWVEVK